MSDKVRYSPVDPTVSYLIPNDVASALKHGTDEEVEQIRAATEAILVANGKRPAPPAEGPKNWAGPTYTWVEKGPRPEPVTLTLLSGMADAPTSKATPGTLAARAMREATITGVVMALAVAIDVAVRHRLPGVAKEISAAGEALVAQIRSQPPTEGT